MISTSTSKACANDSTQTMAGQGPTPHPKRPHGEPPSVIIRQARPSASQLRPQHAILFDQIGQRILVLAIPPAGQNGEPHLERR
jgi:hypothetical protein